MSDLTNSKKNTVAKKTTVFTLGVTGGIGSGKTVVCSMLAKMGARVLNADTEAKRLMVENSEVRQEIISAFGEESYFNDGSLNRRHIASIVFGNDAEIARINNIVHPRMAEVFYKAKASAEADGITLLVYEAALIYESGSAERLDAVVVVHAPEEQRIQRVTTRDEVNAKQVHDRIRHQLPAEELRSKADYVIINDSTLEVLKEKVQSLYDEVTGLDQGSP